MGLYTLSSCSSPKFLKILCGSSESTSLPVSCSSCVWVDRLGEVRSPPYVESMVIFDESDSAVLKKKSPGIVEAYMIHKTSFLYSSQDDYTPAYP